MLVITVKHDQPVVIHTSLGPIEVYVLKKTGSQARLGFKCSKEIRIERTSKHEKTKEIAS